MFLAFLSYENSIIQLKFPSIIPFHYLKFYGSYFVTKVKRAVAKTQLKFISLSCHSSLSSLRLVWRLQNFEGLRSLCLFVLLSSQVVSILSYKKAVLAHADASICQPVGKEGRKITFLSRIQFGSCRHYFITLFQFSWPEVSCKQAWEIV